MANQKKVLGLLLNDIRCTNVVLHLTVPLCAVWELKVLHFQNTKMIIK